MWGTEARTHVTAFLSSGMLRCVVQVDGIIQHFDANRDGQIDRGEFARLAEARPELITGAIRSLMYTFELQTPKTPAAPAAPVSPENVAATLLASGGPSAV